MTRIDYVLVAAAAFLAGLLTMDMYLERPQAAVPTSTPLMMTKPSFTTSPLPSAVPLPSTGITVGANVLPPIITSEY